MTCIKRAVCYKRYLPRIQYRKNIQHDILYYPTSVLFYLSHSLFPYIHLRKSTCSRWWGRSTYRRSYMGRMHTGPLQWTLVLKQGTLKSSNCKFRNLCGSSLDFKTKVHRKHSLHKVNPRIYSSCSSIEMIMFKSINAPLRMSATLIRTPNNTIPWLLRPETMHYKMMKHWVTFNSRHTHNRWHL